MNKITIVGLGPAGPDLLTESVRDLLTGQLPVFLRTGEHPAASAAPSAVTFDDVYDSADKIESVYEEIVERLVVAAIDTDIVYAVPGSPLIAESTVEKLRADSRVEVAITPALSFLDLVWTALGIDPLAHSPRLIDGRRFAIEAAGERGPLLVAQCDQDWVLSDIKLAYEFETPAEVVVLQRLGLPDQVVKTIAWEDLDREVEPDFLTSLWIPKVATPVAYELQRLEEVSRRLRADCPRDQEQTHASLSKHLTEEAYELLEAIDELDGDSDEHLIEELGDVMFQVFAHSAIAAQDGRFNIADVAQVVSDKLIERHPHVYGEAKAASAEEVAESWETNKMKTKGRKSVMEGIPAGLPALIYAAKVLKRAKAAEYPLDIEAEAGVGAGLLKLIKEAEGFDAETELRQATRRLQTRFEEWETNQR